MTLAQKARWRRRVLYVLLVVIAVALLTRDSVTETEAGPSVEHVEVEPAPRLPEGCFETDLDPRGYVCLRTGTLPVPEVVAESIPDVLPRRTDGSR